MINRAGRFLTVGIIWLVIVFGCYFFNVTRPGLGTKWVQLPSLPETGKTVELTRYGFVLASTESGVVYRRALGEADQPWVYYEEATENLNFEPCQADDENRFGVSSPPGKVVSRSSGDCLVSPETTIHAEVALLENGEVWLWTYRYGGVGEAYLSIFLIAAGALGVVILLIGGVMKLYDRRS